MSDTESITLSNEEQAIIDAVSKLNIVQLNNVVKYMEKEFGISAAAPVAMMPMAGAAATTAGSEAVEEKTTVNVELKAAGDQKIAVIKAIREITGLGLKEAKDLVDAAPKIIKENVPREEAMKMQKTLGEVGATVEFK